MDSMPPSNHLYLDITAETCSEYIDLRDGFTKDSPSVGQ